MFWMFQREHSKMFQMFRKRVYKLLKEYLVCWTLHIYFYKKRYIMIVMCVCVWERERERDTHTHTQEGILLRKTKKGSSTERERERIRECTTCEANPAILNQNDLLRKPQRMILMGNRCCGYIDSRAFHDYLDMTLVAPLSSSWVLTCCNFWRRNQAIAQYTSSTFGRSLGCMLQAMLVVLVVVASSSPVKLNTNPDH